MAFAINDIGVGHTKDAFGRFAGAVGNQLWGHAKQIIPRAGAFLGRHLGEGASARRAAEDLVFAAKGRRGAVGAKLRTEANAALAKAMKGKQQRWANTPANLDKKLYGANSTFSKTTGERIVDPKSLQGKVDTAYNKLAPWQQSGVDMAKTVKDFAVPSGAGGVPMAALTFSGLAGLGNKAEATEAGRMQGLAEANDNTANQLNQLGNAGVGDRLSSALSYVKNPQQLNNYATALRNSAPQNMQ